MQKLIYDINKPWLTLDDWQKEYIASEKNCFVLCGRQSGKTTAASIKFAERAVNNKDRVILMIALTEKQAYNLFFKTLMYLEQMHKKEIARGRDKPTKHEIKLKNGSKIMCYAAGLSGDGLRTYTLTDLVIDEAAPMSREIFVATFPMLSVTKGTIDLISTPRGKEGFFYECSRREDFQKFYISAEDCPRHNKEFLEGQKSIMSKLEYAQEYLAVFLDDLKRVFSDELIKACCILQRTANQKPEYEYVCGVDLARLGDDQSTFEIFERRNKNLLVQKESEITEKTKLNESTNKIIELHKNWNFRGIYIDSGGIGVGVTDYLLQDDRTRRITIEINNATRISDFDGSRKRLLKEDLYSNLVSLMEHGKIQLLNDDDVIESLKSVQYEYTIREGHQTQLRIF